jgi:hypothetical protein
MSAGLLKASSSILTTDDEDKALNKRKLLRVKERIEEPVFLLAGNGNVKITLRK